LSLFKINGKNKLLILSIVKEKIENGNTVMKNRTITETLYAHHENRDNFSKNSFSSQQVMQKYEK
jgi:hypothetical protein